MAAVSPATTGAEIVWRAETGWPIDKVPYAQFGAWNDADGRTDEDGYRPDCSGFHSMAQGLPAPGPSTVGLVNHCHRIDWSQIEPGDFVMLGGPGTAGNAGHTSVITAVNRPANTYTILHQGGGLGPDRWTGRIGTAVRSGMVPYRSNYITGGGGLIMFCKHGQSGSDVVEAMQRLGLAAGGQLPRFGPDKDFGDETAAMLVALGVCTGGDPSGRTYGPTEYANLHALVAKRQASGGGQPVLVPHTHDTTGTTGPAKAA